jgi:hypothetical protein
VRQVGQQSARIRSMGLVLHGHAPSSQDRRFSVIAFCKIAFVILNVGSAYLIMVVLPAGDVAGGAYIIALGTGSLIAYRSEMRWRKESGISQ